MGQDGKTNSVEVKRTKSRKTVRKKRVEQPVTTERSIWATIAWVLGMIIVFVSLYFLWSVVAHLFNWESDLQTIGKRLPSDVYAPIADAAESTGPLGIRIANALIGGSFGLFGALIPLLSLIFGLRLLRSRIRILDHAILTIALITVLGSLTLGLAMGVKGEMFGSGWGGTFGIEMAKWLRSGIGIGTVGAWFAVVVCWILIGVFVNIRVIEFINGLGVGVARRGHSFFDKIKNAIFSKRNHDEEAVEEDAEASPVEEEEAAVAEPADEPLEDDNIPDEEPIDDIDDVIGRDEQPEDIEPIEPSADEEPVNDPFEEDEEEPQSPITTITVIDNDPDEQLSDKEADRRPFNPDRTHGYKFPSIELLRGDDEVGEVSDDEIRENKHRIEETLGNFGIGIRDMKATVGPTVTLYEIVQDPGIKIARIQSLANDITQSLRASGIRMIAPMPERGTIGIEVPNHNRAIVSMRSSIRSERFMNYDGELPIVIGLNIQKENFVFDLTKMPHLLVAGATGMGKSVGLNAILTSLLYRKDPSQLKIVLIDPKMVEFSLYAKLERHFLAKMEGEDKAIVTDPKKAVYTLHSLCLEMEARLLKLSQACVRNIKEYNDLVRTCKVEEREIMPYIVVVIDEFADLIMTAKEVEQPVTRLAQKARAVGIHLIVATQRPSVDVITGRIKANFPSRIAFRVMSIIDSRTIIDQTGANALVGKGDMLFSKDGELTRIQCAYVDTPEVSDIVNYIASQPSPTGMAYQLPAYEETTGGGGGADAAMGSESGGAVRYDDKLAEIARDAVSTGQISTSYIQRNYEVGFNRAGRIMTQLERAGIVGPQTGAKQRDVRIYDLPSLEAKLQELGIE